MPAKTADMTLFLAIERWQRQQRAVRALRGGCGQQANIFLGVSSIGIQAEAPVFMRAGWVLKERSIGQYPRRAIRKRFK